MIRKNHCDEGSTKKKDNTNGCPAESSDVTNLWVTSLMYSGQNVCQHNMSHNYEVTRGHNAMETLLENKIKNYDTNVCSHNDKARISKKSRIYQIFKS